MPFQDPAKGAEKYMKENDIEVLFQDLVGFLLFNKPDQPREALVEHLEQLKDAGQGKPLLTLEDLEAMFGMFDITHREVVSVQQANEAIKTILGPTADLRVSSHLDSRKTLNKDEFVRVMRKALEYVAPK
uniref:EF-hand domain-containing protein n=1 Tax=Tetraselmis sp. GSL018 TaxID=582737 RepID=A0A061R101_9CHLO|eukprot:CAMPEP_0177608302 /NCGR_PEP_ID=MMETSP0419_2-20121207/18396_1 /TAXON_ID=582737 /ORGANISM="Tetraselmis sp., Strain GSL018" /LENGTH=129 /DNA_ID=CAMNT_0019102977 /DNA_START=114 /DNA_END=503 /DNA_ORIENTATION=+